MTDPIADFLTRIRNAVSVGHKVVEITGSIKSLVRVSKPGLRRYTNVEEMPRVLNGLGIAILSTSMGLMTDKEARQRNVGGEVLCYVY